MERYWYDRGPSGTRYAPGGIYRTRARGLKRAQYRSFEARQRRALRREHRRLSQKKLISTSLKQYQGAPARNAVPGR